MNGEKVILYADKSPFENSGKIFTLIGGVLRMINGYKFNTTDSPDSKLIIDIIDKMHFDIQSQGKSLR